MAFQKKNKQVEPVVAEYRFEDGITADTPPEIREAWLAEYHAAKRKAVEQLNKRVAQ